VTRIAAAQASQPHDYVLTTEWIMTRINARKAFAALSLAAAGTLAVAGVVSAQPGYGMMPGFGMGPGMMGYGHGYGMGPGMMGFGPSYGMGSGMMAGYGWDCHGAYGGVDLTKEQQAKLASIQDELAREQFDRMNAMHEEQAKLRGLYSAPQRDDSAIAASRERLRKLQEEIHQAALDARKAMDAVLTPDQREQMRRGWAGARAL
jgi:Spy/CpxP family protein refolding chaperone